MNRLPSLTQQAFLAVGMAGLYLTAQEMIVLGRKLGLSIDPGTREEILGELLKGVRQQHLQAAFKEEIKKILASRDRKIARLAKAYPALVTWRTKWQEAGKRLLVRIDQELAGGSREAS
ncbi:MAG: hypothetical protein K6347_05120 [Campylobacterales bacterium]